VESSYLASQNKDKTEPQRRRRKGIYTVPILKRKTERNRNKILNLKKIKNGCLHAKVLSLKRIIHAVGAPALLLACVAPYLSFEAGCQAALDVQAALGPGQPPVLEQKDPRLQRRHAANDPKRYVVPHQRGFRREPPLSPDVRSPGVSETETERESGRESLCRDKRT
jgi:hypothetical protein